MAGRQVFSDTEKACLRELIIKYKLNATGKIGARNPYVKKRAWARLTEEYNSIEINSKRTETQLKKCWDNLKTRRKQVLALEKRERMKTGGRAYIPTPSSQEIDDPLQDLSDVETRFLCDSDSVLDDSQGATNVRAHVITEEFNLRKEQYDQNQRRDEELHKLKVAEQEWLVKAAQEKYNKARLERECAKEILRFNQVQREEAELRLQMLKNKE